MQLFLFSQYVHWHELFGYAGSEALEVYGWSEAHQLPTIFSHGKIHIFLLIPKDKGASKLISKSDAQHIGIVLCHQSRRHAASKNLICDSWDIEIYRIIHTIINGLKPTASFKWRNSLLEKMAQITNQSL